MVCWVSLKGKDWLDGQTPKEIPYLMKLGRVKVVKFEVAGPFTCDTPLSDSASVQYDYKLGQEQVAILSVWVGALEGEWGGGSM
eukprot:scaffold31697_cov17-Tisochrysis_lutea.AAC.1